MPVPHVAPPLVRVLVYALPCGLWAVLAAGCAPEERVVNYTPFFDGLEGAGGARRVRDGVVAGQEGDGAGTTDPTASADALPQELVQTTPEGKKRIVSRSVRHVMVHLATLLNEGDDDTLYEQLLADHTKRHFAEQGKDARAESLAYFKGHREEIMALFARMPMAERSPGVLLEPAGGTATGRLFKLRLQGTAARGVMFTDLWLAVEKGQWKLVWVD